MNARQLKTFLALPMNLDETWQGGILGLTDALDLAPRDDADDLVLILWRSTTTQIVHAKPAQLPRGQRPADEFTAAMMELHTKHELSFRPAVIECNDHELTARMKDLLRDSDTDVCFVEELPEWNELVREMTDMLSGAAPDFPSLMEAGCGEQQIREFAEAAAAFFRAKLWNYLDDVDLIKIETPKPPRYLKYAVVLGAAAQSYGLGFFDDAEDHYAMMSQRADPRDLNLFSFSFDNPADVNTGDVDMWHELGLPLETGDAFPSLHFISRNGTRRPRPRELDVTTIILKALASTSEEEIDQGRWTKSVSFLGKQKKCVLSIPNLIEPPDRAEWLRRGLTPEPRGNERHFKLVQQFIENNADHMSLDELNEAINDRFVGPIDDVEHPMDTPADRADAMCNQAIDTFGRRRVQLAKEALAEDPTHLEANLLLAESTRPVDRRIELLQQAVELGKTQLGSVLEEEVGHFWGLQQTRPYMRACHELAQALHEDGQTNGAIQQYYEMLRLNPNDNQGVRNALIPLLVAHNRESEAIELLNRYREETAFWHYTNSLVEFRRNRHSVNARKAIRSAFRANQHVIQLMQSDEMPRFPDSYSLGSPQEAAVCIEELGEIWNETEDFVDWMFKEFFLWEEDRVKQLHERKRKQRRKTTKKRQQ